MYRIVMLNGSTVRSVQYFRRKLSFLLGNWTSLCKDIVLTMAKSATLLCKCAVVDLYKLYQHKHATVKNVSLDP